MQQDHLTDHKSQENQFSILQVDERQLFSLLNVDTALSFEQIQIIEILLEEDDHESE